MSTKFLRKEASINADFEGVFFDGNNSAEVIAFYLSRKKPEVIHLDWDGPWVSEIKFPTILLPRNKWLLWDSEVSCFRFASAEFATEQLVELS